MSLKITIEGNIGEGKSTLLREISRHLANLNYDVTTYDTIGRNEDIFIIDSKSLVKKSVQIVIN